MTPAGPPRPSPRFAGDEVVVVAAGFGASDCRRGCGAHLKYLGPDPDALSALGQAHDQ